MMEKINKMKLLSLLFASVLLAACAGNETEEEDTTASTQGADASSSAQTEAYGSQELSGGAVAEEEVQEPVKQLVTLYYFEFDQSRLTAETRSNLDEAADQLKATDASFRLEGHADERGTREYNLALGERRAKAIADYLAVQGIDRSRMEIVSYGEEKPVAMGSNEEAWAKNRRVELVK